MVYHDYGMVLLSYSAWGEILWVVLMGLVGGRLRGGSQMWCTLVGVPPPLFVCLFALERGGDKRGGRLGLLTWICSPL